MRYRCKYVISIVLSRFYLVLPFSALLRPSTRPGNNRLNIAFVRFLDLQSFY